MEYLFAAPSPTYSQHRHNNLVKSYESHLKSRKQTGKTQRWVSQRESPLWHSRAQQARVLCLVVMTTRLREGQELSPDLTARWRQRWHWPLAGTVHSPLNRALQTNALQCRKDACVQFQQGLLSGRVKRLCLVTLAIEVMSFTAGPLGCGCVSHIITIHQLPTRVTLSVSGSMALVTEAPSLEVSRWFGLYFPSCPTPRPTSWSIGTTGKLSNQSS